MTEKVAAKRLSKVAKEFNIATTTIVEYLKSRNIEIESNPNTKLAEEIYLILTEKYQPDKIVNEYVGLQRVKKREEIIEEEVSLLTSKVSDETSEILIKSNILKPEIQTATNDFELVKEPEIRVKEEKVEIKEVKSKEEDVEKAEKKDVKVKEGDEKAAISLKVIKKIELDEIDKTKKKKKEELIKSTETTKEKPDKTDEAIELVKEPEKKEKDQLDKKEKKTDKEEIIEKTEDLKVFEKESPTVKEVEKEINKDKSGDLIAEGKGLKIVGKIDVDAIKFERKKRKPVASTADPSTMRKKRRKRVYSKSQGEFTKKKDQTNLNETKQKAKIIKKKKGKKTDNFNEKVIKEQISATLAKLASKQDGGVAARAKLRRKKKKELREKETIANGEEQRNIIEVIEFITVNELANLMDVPVTDVITVCLSLGLMVSINQRLDAETITIVADEFDFDVEFTTESINEPILEEEDNPDNMVERAPVVTIMGHVDHGKTSLLDFIRKTNVMESEAGGITQHIGAYDVTLSNGKKIAFLDTPGHEAFTSMRARGARVTDIVIIVIAADDSVMPQTKEAISHAQAANVPIVFAFNKIDKSTANAEKIKEQLSKMNILVEDWGGKYQSQEISAKSGKNIDELLEKVLIETELLELKADTKKRAVGTVVEASLDKGKGIIATILVQKGTLKIGDPILAGAFYGKVKAMVDEHGRKTTDVGPSTPVEVLGFDGTPTAGDTFYVTESEQQAKEIANSRKRLKREHGIRATKHITLDEIGRRIAIGDFKELNIIVKGDVDGSVEALSDSLQKLSTENVQVNIIHKAVGQISEGDVLLATASDAIIVGFQVRPSLLARKMAEKEQIDIRSYSVIYDAIEELQLAIEGLLEPVEEEKVTCNIEIREIFKIKKAATVAGCMVLDGKVTRNNQVRILREGVVIYTGNIGSLKRFKDDVKEVNSGYECGLSVENYNDIKVGDIIEGFIIELVKQKT